MKVLCPQCESAMVFDGAFWRCSSRHCKRVFGPFPPAPVPALDDRSLLALMTAMVYREDTYTPTLDAIETAVALLERVNARMAAQRKS